MINQQHLDLLTAGLRSGRFKQTTGALHRFIDGEVGNCCLGVACIIAIENGLELEYLDDIDQRFYLDNPELEDDPDAPRRPGDYNQGAELTCKVRDWYGFDSRDPLILVNADMQQVREVSATTANDIHSLDFNAIADAFDLKYKESTSG